jgi:hypothetical protein
MKRNILKSIIVCTGLFFVFACKKNPPVQPAEELPALTHEGKNTFGCKVNGTIWIPKANFTVGGAIAIDNSYKEATGGLTLKATKKTSDESTYEYLIFFGVNLFEEGVYEMSVLNEDITGFADLTKSKYSCGGFKHDTLNKGILNITHLDKEKNIIAGTFSMTLISSDYCVETTYLQITEGRFDLPY